MLTCLLSQSPPLKQIQAHLAVNLCKYVLKGVNRIDLEVATSVVQLLEDMDRVVVKHADSAYQLMYFKLKVKQLTLILI